MPDNEAKKIDTEGEIREIARHVALAAGKIGTTVELREEVGALAAAVAHLVAEVHPIAQALPNLVRKEEIKDSKKMRQRIFITIGFVALGLMTVFGIAFALNRAALNEGDERTCRAINSDRAVLRDLITNSTANADQPIDPTLPENVQELIRDSRERSIAFRDQALKDLADNRC